MKHSDLKILPVLLITGTPIQNNLSELWSLMHFCMPMVFGTLEQFLSTFKEAGDFSTLGVGLEPLCNEAYMQATVFSTQVIRVSSSVGDRVGFHKYAQRKIFIVTSRVVPPSLQALQHKLLYCHTL
ncbi:hypothetical protein C5167_047888 [Papaver somniferum]|uniref:SNF2 N-terminal domain-containing protein n=1 Tax=Papaver somniferum TaxID=3469 RepID=A0A4Y7LHX9_PAPSO|nr:hypothetical protein C5167_047888 [Papaver somniferum]